MESLATEFFGLIAESPYEHPSRNDSGLILRNKDLASWARVSRRIHSQVNSLLYKTIVIRKRSTLRLMLRTILKNPNLAKHVRTVFYDWNPNRKITLRNNRVLEKGLKQIHPKYEELIAKALKSGMSIEAEGILLLLLLPKLRSLNLIFGMSLFDTLRPTAGLFLLPLMVMFLQELAVTNALPCIRELYIANPFDVPDDIGVLTSIETMFWNLKTLQGIFLFMGLRKIELSQCTSPLGLKCTSAQERTMALEDITIINSAITIGDMRTILNLSKAVKIFKYHVANANPLWHLDAMREEFTNLAALITELRSHKNSLHTLEIFSIARCVSWQSLDEDMPEFWYVSDDEDEEYGSAGLEEMESLYFMPEGSEKVENYASQIKSSLISQFDLREFCALKTARLQATDLLGPMRREAPLIYTALQEVLPPNIESLDLWYSNYFQERGPQLQCNWRQPDHDWYLTYYTHIRDLISAKSEKVPRLQNLSLCFSRTSDWSRDFGAKGYWPDVPQDILDMARAYRLNLTVAKTPYCRSVAHYYGYHEIK